MSGCDLPLPGREDRNASFPPFPPPLGTGTLFHPSLRKSRDDRGPYGVVFSSYLPLLREYRALASVLGARLFCAE